MYRISNDSFRDSVMSSASSAVTYTFVYTDSELGRVFRGANEELSDGGKMTLRAQETCMIWLGHIGGLEGDEEGLVDVLVKLETSFDEVFTPFDAAASTRRNKKIMCNFKQYKWKIF
ncbi:hypothetical protein Tco_0371388 [Tanacetum coccineum]